MGMMNHGGKSPRGYRVESARLLSITWDRLLSYTSLSAPDSSFSFIGADAREVYIYIYIC